MGWFQGFLHRLFAGLLDGKCPDTGNIGPQQHLGTVWGYGTGMCECIELPENISLKHTETN